MVFKTHSTECWGSSTIEVYLSIYLSCPTFQALWLVDTVLWVMALIGWHNILCVQYKCTALLDPVTMGICPKKNPLTMQVCPMKKLVTLRRNLMRLTIFLQGECPGIYRPKENIILNNRYEVLNSLVTAEFFLY